MHRRTLDWTNDTTNTLELIYEPDGMPISVEAGASVRVICCGSEPGDLEAEHSDQGLVVFGWPTSKAEVFVDGSLVYTSPIAVPAVPPGTSTREFMAGIFGSPTKPATEEPG